MVVCQVVLIHVMTSPRPGKWFLRGLDQRAGSLLWRVTDELKPALGGMHDQLHIAVGGRVGREEAVECAGQCVQTDIAQCRFVEGKVDFYTPHE